MSRGGVREVVRRWAREGREGAKTSKDVEALRGAERIVVIIKLVISLPRD
jgi:hypothetical protein